MELLALLVVAALLAESWQWLADTQPEREAAAFQQQLAASVHTLKQVEAKLCTI